jgi:hypothetical protein
MPAPARIIKYVSFFASTGYISTCRRKKILDVSGICGDNVSIRCLEFEVNVYSMGEIDDQEAYSC